MTKVLTGRKGLTLITSLYSEDLTPDFFHTHLDLDLVLDLYLGDLNLDLERDLDLDHERERDLFSTGVGSNGGIFFSLFFSSSWANSTNGSAILKTDKSQ